ncbi:MAG: GTP 3',8-cyclase MoaA [Thermodesulfobacteriota bacterium]
MNVLDKLVGVNEGQGKLVDAFSRSVSYLRVSLTDQCNLRCFYCTPRPLDDKLPVGELLSYEELLRVIKGAAALGIRKVRLTGGEPLVRRDITGFIRQLMGIEGIEEVRITTNGVLLAEKAAELYDAGIRKLNISLDTLKPERFRKITGVNAFAQVWQGVEQALQRGFSTVKINVVAMNGINDDEFIDFAKMSMTKPVQVRFIEFMPMGNDSNWHEDYYVTSAEIMAKIANLGELTPISSGKLDGPARTYRLPDALGTVGFISPISDHFCSQCNRLRLTSEGQLRSCLLTDNETDLKSIIRGGGSEDDIRAALIETIKHKPKGHNLSESEINNCHGRMSRIGG